MPDYTFVPCGTGDAPAVCFIRPRGTMDNPEIITETVDPGHSLQVQMVVSNFTLRGPGQCQGAERCGHIHIRVTANSLDSPGMMVPCDVPGHPYNASGAELVQAVNFDVCDLTIPMTGFQNRGARGGPHTITAELFDDNHIAVPGAQGDTVFVALPLMLR
jgi:hypothetical protein